MKNASSEPLPIPNKDVEEYERQMLSKVSLVGWKPEDLPESNETKELTSSSSQLMFVSNMRKYIEDSRKSMGTGGEDVTHITKSVEAIDGNRVVMSEDANFIINTIVTGFAIGSSHRRLPPSLPRLPARQRRQRSITPSRARWRPPTGRSLPTK